MDFQSASCTRIYTPAVSVWVFLSQCLSVDHSCREAVARLIAWRVSRGLRPWQISFQGTLQTLNQFLPNLSKAASLEAWLCALLTAIATHTVGDRPDRYEPRLRKRRPKPYKHLRQHRASYKRNSGV